MIKEIKTAWDFGWTVLIITVYAGSAWLMAMGGWVYPPVPMFLAALLGGWFFRGRPQSAARASLWVGFMWGWVAEWAYFYVRLNETTGTWLNVDVLERFGLGFAEITLYTALLSFFSAFIAWGSDQTSSAVRSESLTSSVENHPITKMEIPFQPEDTSITGLNKIPKNNNPD